jgi:hypothetical protein
MKLLLILLFLFVMVWEASAGSSDVTLMWDPPEIATDVVGYKIHYGTESRAYTNEKDVGLILTGTIDSLPKSIYYFAATAYNAALYESEYSNEVSMVVIEPNFKLIFE